MIKLITRVALWILRKIRKDQKEQKVLRKIRKDQKEQKAQKSQKEEKATITKPTDKPSQQINQALKTA